MPLCRAHQSQASSSLLLATYLLQLANVCSPKHIKTSMLYPDGRPNQSASLTARNWTRRNFTKTTKLKKKVSCLLTAVPMTKWLISLTTRFKWLVKLKVFTKTRTTIKQPTSLHPPSKSKTNSCNISTLTWTSRIRSRMLSNKLKIRFNPTLKMTSTRQTCKETLQQRLTTIITLWLPL